MKNIFIKTMIIVLLTSASACDQSLEEINIDPNYPNPETVAVEYFFPSAVASTAGVIGGDYNLIGGIWSQYWTQNNASNQYKDVDAFIIQPSTFELGFAELYAGALNDLKFVKNRSKADGNWSYYLMATVMEAYTFQVVADLYGSVPFDEALRAEEGLLHPVYREGSVIYDSLIVRIDNALARDLDAETSENPGTADFIFGGDMEKWIQFANTLKLKIYLRQVYARPNVAEAGIEALYNAGAEFLSEDAAMTQFVDQQDKSNPLYEQDQRRLNTPNNLRASTTLFAYLEANDDPRLSELYQPGTPGQPLRPLRQGDFNAPNSGATLATGLARALLRPTDPVYFISEPESYFLQAEARERYFGGDEAKELYDAGVDAAFDRFNLNGGSFTDAGGAYAYPVAGTFEEKLEQIILQKWVAMAGAQGLEAFFERNRTGYPAANIVDGEWVDYGSAGWEPGKTTYPIEGVSENERLPRRLLFTDYERTRNPNTPNQMPFTTPVWWDVNPNSQYF